MSLKEKGWIGVLFLSVMLPVGLLTTFKFTGAMQPQQTYTLENRPAELDITAHPMKLYVVCLDGVGSSLEVNLSTVVEGVLEAAKVNVTRVWIGPYQDLSCSVNFQVDVNVVSDWNTYRSLIENGGNVTVVNVHNEILPVPDGFTKEAWLSKIGDFLANRWGSWVDTGGMPFRYVQYENGTQEEWGPQGFSTFMSYIGGANETCTTPAEFSGPNDGAVGVEPAYLGYVALDWTRIPSDSECTIGYPMKWDSFTEGLFVGAMFDVGSISGKYSVGASIEYKPESSFSFGYYIHFGVVQVYSVYNVSTDFCLGYMPTAEAIFDQVGAPVYDLLSYQSGAWGELNSALLQGRTQGLDEAFTLYGEAGQEYLEGHCIQSFGYAQEVIDAARNATKPQLVTSQTALVGIAVAIPTTALAHVVNKRRREQA